MFHRFKLVMAGTALLAFPGAAQAQPATGEILINSTVTAACGMGTPDTNRIDLLDLTGPDGTLDSTKTGNDVLGTATIEDAWCNAPHTLSLQSTAMTLQRTLPYALPTYMTRRVTFDARLVGWFINTTIRPRNDNDLTTIEIPQAFAAPSPGLRLNVSNLETLNGVNSETPGLMLEPGSYLGTVTITLAAAS